MIIYIKTHLLNVSVVMYRHAPSLNIK